MSDSPLLAPRYRIGWGVFLPRLLMVLGIFLGGSVFVVRLAPDGSFAAWSLCFVLLFFLLQRRELQRQLRQHAIIVALVRAGSFSEAGRQLDELCARPASMPAHMMYVFSRAVTLQCTGQFSEALPLYRAVLEARGWGPGRVLAAFGSIYRARAAEAHAWAGELEAAEVLLEEAGGVEHAGEPGVLPAAILALRRAEPGQALDILDAGWESLEEVRNDLELAPARLVYLLALRQLDRADGARWAQREGELSDEALVVTHWAGTSWPEVAELIRGLKRARREALGRGG